MAWSEVLVMGGSGRARCDSDAVVENVSDGGKRENEM